MTTTKALEGVTVLDLSHLLQGPFATQLLADLGANVIKVERPGQGDLFRTLTFNNRWVGGRESPNFLAWNRNKRSLALDLKRPRSEEHTSELQSLMRISYAVFCLKKKQIYKEKTRAHNQRKRHYS